MTAARDVERASGTWETLQAPHSGIRASQLEHSSRTAPSLRELAIAVDDSMADVAPMPAPPSLPAPPMRRSRLDAVRQRRQRHRHSHAAACEMPSAPAPAPAAEPAEVVADEAAAAAKAPAPEGIDATPGVDVADVMAARRRPLGAARRRLRAEEQAAEEAASEAAAKAAEAALADASERGMACFDDLMARRALRRAEVAGSARVAPSPVDDDGGGAEAEKAFGAAAESACAADEEASVTSALAAIVEEDEEEEETPTADGAEEPPAAEGAEPADVSAEAPVEVPAAEGPAAVTTRPDEEEGMPAVVETKAGESTAADEDERKSAEQTEKEMVEAPCDCVEGGAQAKEAVESLAGILKAPAAASAAAGSAKRPSRRVRVRSPTRADEIPADASTEATTSELVSDNAEKKEKMEKEEAHAPKLAVTSEAAGAGSVSYEDFWRSQRSGLATSSKSSGRRRAAAGSASAEVDEPTAVRTPRIPRLPPRSERARRMPEADGEDSLRASVTEMLENEPSAPAESSTSAPHGVATRRSAQSRTPRSELRSRGELAVERDDGVRLQNLRDPPEAFAAANASGEEPEVASGAGARLQKSRDTSKPSAAASARGGEVAVANDVICGEEPEVASDVRARSRKSRDASAEPSAVENMRASSRGGFTSTRPCEGMRCAANATAEFSDAAEPHEDTTLSSATPEVALERRQLMERLRSKQAGRRRNQGSPDLNLEAPSVFDHAARLDEESEAAPTAEAALRRSRLAGLRERRRERQGEERADAEVEEIVANTAAHLDRRDLHTEAASVPARADRMVAGVSAAEPAATEAPVPSAAVAYDAFRREQKRGAAKRAGAAAASTPLTDATAGDRFSEPVDVQEALKWSREVRLSRIAALRSERGAENLDLDAETAALPRRSAQAASPRALAPPPATWADEESALAEGALVAAAAHAAEDDVDIAVASAADSTPEAEAKVASEEEASSEAPEPAPLAKIRPPLPPASRAPEEAVQEMKLRWLRFKSRQEVASSRRERMQQPRGLALGSPQVASEAIEASAPLLAAPEVVRFEFAPALPSPRGAAASPLQSPRKRGASQFAAGASAAAIGGEGIDLTPRAALELPKLADTSRQPIASFASSSSPRRREAKKYSSKADTCAQQ
eukprot:TRINITY_DN16356_c0_g1_i2.p1 TRINITY_DN16356_c0_g1~~TRINITY_DN16356_c0_g1_i2.p1  ORF type:complete len:1143 (+),score=323.67 TRINITY_DN16356_c0_g1_i2:24-3452(+)